MTSQSAAVPLSDSIEREVRPWLDLVDQLRNIGVQEYLPLPQVGWTIMCFMHY